MLTLGEAKIEILGFTLKVVSNFMLVLGKDKILFFNNTKKL